MGPQAASLHARNLDDDIVPPVQDNPRTGARSLSVVYLLQPLILPCFLLDRGVGGGGNMRAGCGAVMLCPSRIGGTCVVLLGSKSL